MLGGFVTAVCCWKAAPGLRLPRELEVECATRGGNPFEEAQDAALPDCDRVPGRRRLPCGAPRAAGAPR